MSTKQKLSLSLPLALLASSNFISQTFVASTVPLLALVSAKWIAAVYCPVFSFSSVPISISSVVAS